MGVGALVQKVSSKYISPLMLLAVCAISQGSVSSGHCNFVLFGAIMDNNAP